MREQNTAAIARADAKGMSQLTCQCQHNDCQNKGLKARRLREQAEDAPLRWMIVPAAVVDPTLETQL